MRTFYTGNQNEYQRDNQLSDRTIAGSTVIFGSAANDFKTNSEISFQLAGVDLNGTKWLQKGHRRLLDDGRCSCGICGKPDLRSWVGVDQPRLLMRLAECWILFISYSQLVLFPSLTFQECPIGTRCNYATENILFGAQRLTLLVRWTKITTN